MRCDSISLFYDSWYGDKIRSRDAPNDHAANAWLKSVAQGQQSSAVPMASL
jgi:hypothetical protein